MNITFADNKLKKYANNYKMAVKKLGKKQADLFNRRLGDLKQTNNYEELQFLPGNYHNLKGVRKGQWACYLDHPYRLIFQPVTLPDTNGTYILIELIDAEIIEIVDYH